MEDKAVRDKKNPNIWREGDITIIKIPELGDRVEMRFNFNLGSGIELNAKLSTEERHQKHKTEQLFSSKEGIPSGGVITAWERVVDAKFKTLNENDKAETEKLIDKMLNHPSPSEKRLQHEFNESIVKTYINNKDSSGKPIPLDVGHSEALTASEFGGALLEKKGGQPALGINLESMKQAKYVYIDQANGLEINKNHAASPVDIFRHEFFHYIDTHMQAKSNGPDSGKDGEPRAVWYVNQFQAARGEPKRASYEVTSDEKLLPKILETLGVLGDKMPRGDAPSLNNLRNYTSGESRDKEQKNQPQSSADKQFLPGLAGFAIASEIFLKEKSGLLPENQARIQSIVEGRLVAYNADGKDIALVINDSKQINIASNHELEPKFS